MGCCNSTAADVERQRQQREIAANGLREACRRGDPVMIKALMRNEFQASSENFVNTICLKASSESSQSAARARRPGDEADASALFGARRPCDAGRSIDHTCQ